MEYLDKLNEEQLKCVKQMDGPCLVLAGAGSGKTRVLTSRIVYLIQNGIKPYNILAITFTNKAATEMKERVKSLIGDTSSFIGTFHSFGLKIIRENTYDVGLNPGFSIIDADDTISIIKKILKELNLDSKKFSPKYIKDKISKYKNNMTSNLKVSYNASNFIDDIAIKVYEKYEEILEKSNAVDFDDLLLKPVILFEQNSEILEKYQDHYPYILIDEYQDTNPVQYKLANLLSEKYRNIFVVGDMNQSIYGFRQADYRNIIKFESDYKDVNVFKLEQNYRSTETILKAANSVIKNNIQKRELNLWSTKKGEPYVKYLRAYDGIHEIKLVIDEIKKLYNTYNSYNSFSILYRSNAQSRTVEQILLENNIPYKIYGGFAYLKRKEIKDLIAYLKFINNTEDMVSLRRIINTPKRGIGEASINRIEAESLLENIPVMDAFKTKKELDFKNIILEIKDYFDNHTLTETVDYIILRSGMKEAYEIEKTLESEIRLENLYEFKSLTLSYEEKHEDKSLDNFLNELSLMSDSDSNEENKDAVNIMTIHSAKGLEFDVVFIIGLEEGIFPNSNALLEENGIDEERRLCYVGITRARDVLYITNAKRRLLYGKELTNIPSRFIDEIDSNLIKTNTLAKREIQSYDNVYINNNDGLKTGDIINHEKFGHGIITKLDGDFITVAFKSGIKTLNKNHKSITKA